MPRIFQTHVPALFPSEGPVRIFLMGEAPGPRGADQSGIPFWGDRAGLPVYRALADRGLAEVPPGAWEDWDGARLKGRALAPVLRGVALGNAYPCCPTRDGHSFQAPTDRELRDPENLARLGQELGAAQARCPGILRVVTFGRRAAWIVARLEGLAALDLHALPHPSAQGLLQAAPDKGRGLRLADLQAAWEANLRALLAK